MFLRPLTSERSDYNLLRKPVKNHLLMVHHLTLKPKKNKQNDDLAEVQKRHVNN